MKKQYYIEGWHNYPYPMLVTLYHDGKYYCNKIISTKYRDEFLDWAEEHGYTRGYRKEEIHVAAEHYHFLLANAIEELNK